MHKKPKPKNRFELARLLAAGAVALREHADTHDNPGYPQLSISMKFNLSVFFHDQGRRVLIAAAYITKRSRVQMVKKRIEDTIRNRAPGDLHIDSGCFSLIINPSSKFVFSLVAFIIAIKFGPNMPPEVLEKIRTFLESAPGS